MPVQSRATRPTVLRARNAVAAVFAFNGFAMASWTARIPEARDALGIAPGQLGGLLLGISLGSLAAMPLAGALVRRFGATATVTGAAVVNAFGLAGAGIAAAAGQY